ncbi:uncharacterized protein LOC126834182 isoform X2 [Adelges cooleyi]|uniref:uncharacterized protein LOC126834182 isoform X2 n=1 Tax=Adelges cooleyi TaxID=133065 RepID=UPI00217FBAA3|nr:uncharacterized protein LOC126834182 isoform X2 [Adelges cooleyi]
MRRFCFFILFVVVAVLAVDLDDYIREFRKTNKQIRVADKHVRFLQFIREMVGGDTPMVKLSYMFAAPELVDSEIELRAAITTLLGVDVPKRGVVRTAMRKMGLDPNLSRDVFSVMIRERKDLFRTTINTIIYGASKPGHEDFGNVYLMCRLKGVLRSILDPYSFVKEAEVVGDDCRLTFNNNITITSSGISSDSITYTPQDYLTYIALGNRQIERVECRDVRLIPVIRQLVRGDTPMLQLSCMFAAPKLTSDLLVNENENGLYGEILRQLVHSQVELQIQITDLLGVDVPEIGDVNLDPSDPLAVEKERKTLFRDSIKLSINAALRPGHEDFGDYKLMCRLKGIYRSILDPDSFVKEVEVVGEECHLKEMNNTVHVVSCIGKAV